MFHWIPAISCPLVLRAVSAHFRANHWGDRSQTWWRHSPLYFPGSTYNRVGITKPIFSVPLFSHFFGMIKTLVTCVISSSYLAGVTAAELRRHLANMNMIEIIWLILLLNKISRNGEISERSFSNPHHWPRSTVIPPFPGICLVEQFPCICRQTVDQVKLKFGEQTHWGPPLGFSAHFLTNR